MRYHDGKSTKSPDPWHLSLDKVSELDTTKNLRNAMIWPDLHSSQSFRLLSWEKSGLKGEKCNEWKEIRWKTSGESRQDPGAHRQRMTVGLQGGEQLKDAWETERSQRTRWLMGCRRWEKEKSPISHEGNYFPSQGGNGKGKKRIKHSFALIEDSVILISCKFKTDKLGRHFSHYQSCLYFTKWFSQELL